MCFAPQSTFRSKNSSRITHRQVSGHRPKSTRRFAERVAQRQLDPYEEPRISSCIVARTSPCAHARHAQRSHGGYEFLFWMRMHKTGHHCMMPEYAKWLRTLHAWTTRAWWPEPYTAGDGNSKIVKCNVVSGAASILHDSLTGDGRNISSSHVAGPCETWQLVPRFAGGKQQLKSALPVKHATSVLDFCRSCMNFLGVATLRRVPQWAPNTRQEERKHIEVSTLQPTLEQTHYSLILEARWVHQMHQVRRLKVKEQGRPK